MLNFFRLFFSRFKKYKTDSGVFTAPVTATYRIQSNPSEYCCQNKAHQEDEAMKFLRET